MTEIIDTIRNGFRVRIFRCSFMMGIGLDQLTPHVHEIIFSRTMDEVLKSKSTRVVTRHTDPQSFSLQKSNYGRRARHKH